MTESSSFDNELYQQNSNLENVRQENLLNRLSSGKEDFTKLFLAEIGLPLGLEGTGHGLKGLYKSTGLQAKVDTGIDAIKARVSNLIQPYKDRLSSGLDSIKGYFGNGLDNLQSRAVNQVSDSLSGLRSSLTGAARDKLDAVQGQFENLKSDLGGRYKDAVSRLETLRQQGVAEGSAKYREALGKVSDLKGELSSRVSDLQNQASDVLDSARDQITEKARSVGDQLKGQASEALSRASGSVKEAQDRVASLQDEVARGVEGAGDRLTAAQGDLQSAITNRTTALADQSPEVLQSIQETARSKYLTATQRLRDLQANDIVGANAENPEITRARQTVSDLGEQLIGATKYFSDRTSAIQSLGTDALRARKAAALNAVEEAKRNLTRSALGDGADAPGVIKDAQDQLISAQTRLRGTLADLGESTGDIGGFFSRGVVGLGGDLTGALPALALDLGTGAGAVRTSEDTGIAAALNRGISIAGDAFNKAKSSITGISQRFQNLRPRRPSQVPEGEVANEAGSVDQLGGDLDAVSGDAMGAVKSLSSQFVRAGRPTQGYLQSLFGDSLRSQDLNALKETFTGATSESGVPSLFSRMQASATDALGQARAGVTDALGQVATQARAGATDVMGQISSGANSIVSEAAGARASLPSFSFAQAAHPGTALSNINRAQMAASEEAGNVDSLTNLLGGGRTLALDALEKGATAVQGGVLEGGLGELGVGAAGLGEDAAAGIAGAVESAGEAVAASTGETGIGAFLGGLGIVGGLLGYELGSHDSEPAPIAVPNFSVPVFQPSGGR